MVDWSQLRARSVHVADGLSELLEELIADGRIPMGERLPSERVLAQELSVSRTTLREALHQLELKGLVDRRPGRGTIVVDRHRGELGDSMLARLDDADRSLREVMDLRAVIEPPIAARAAARATARDVAALRGLLEQLERETAIEAGARLDVRFHETIARATHNPLLVRLLGFAADWIDESRRERALSPERRERSIAGHRAILDAIERHDEAAAFAAMERHIADVNQLLSGGRGIA